MYVLGCGSNSIVLLKLDAADGVVDFVDTYYTSAGGSSSGAGMLQIEALQHAVVAARSESDEVIL